MTPSSNQSLMADMFTGTLFVDETTHTVMLRDAASGRAVALSFGDVLTATHWRVTIMPGQYREALVPKGNVMGNTVSMPNDETLFLAEMPVPEEKLALLLDAMLNEERVTLELENPILKDAERGMLGHLVPSVKDASGDFNWRMFGHIAGGECTPVQLGDTLTVLTHQGAEAMTVTVDFMMLRGMAPGFKHLPNYQTELDCLFQAFKGGQPVILKRG